MANPLNAVVGYAAALPTAKLLEGVAIVAAINTSFSLAASGFITLYYGGKVISGVLSPVVDFISEKINKLREQNLPTVETIRNENILQCTLSPIGKGKWEALLENQMRVQIESQVDGSMLLTVYRPAIEDLSVSSFTMVEPFPDVDLSATSFQFSEEEDRADWF